ncbi:MAG: hypothetical protein JRH11_21735 [Deltaproteobacteria bacterium]|nr:hypothetical protein [Deltaproteobacteria bacterium]
MPPPRASTLLALVLPCGLLAVPLLGGCGLLLDVDPRPDASGPAIDNTPPLSCDYFVFIDGAGTGETMDDANPDLAGTAQRADAEGGGVVCVASRGVPEACEGTTYEDAVDIGRGVTLQGGFLAGQQPWAWDPQCKPTIRGREPSWASVVFIEEADSTSALTYMRVTSPHDVDSNAAVLFFGGGTITNSRIRASAANTAAGVLSSEVGLGQPIAIIDTDVLVSDAPSAMVAVQLTGHPTTITGSSLKTEGTAVMNTGVVLTDAAGSRIADGNRIVVSQGDEYAVAIAITGMSDGITIEDNGLIRVADSENVDEDAQSAAIITGPDCTGAIRIEGNQEIIGGGPRGVSPTNIAAAIAALGCDVTIRGNRRITGRDEPGVGRAIGVACRSNCLIEDNVIAGAEDGARADTYNIGVLVYQGVADIRRNEIEACAGAGAGLCGGVYMHSSMGSVVAANVIQARDLDGLHAGVTLVGSSTEVVNNVIALGSGVGILADSPPDGSPVLNTALIHFNTLVEDRDDGEAGFFTGVSTGTDDPGRFAIHDNLAVCSSSTGHRTFLHQSTESPAPPDLSHNALYGCAALSNGSLPGMYYNVAELESILLGGTTTNTVELDTYPFMGRDYHLDRSSPARDAAHSTGDTPADDIDGDLRDATPDIGADEVVTG